MLLLGCVSIHSNLHSGFFELLFFIRNITHTVINLNDPIKFMILIQTHPLEYVLIFPKLVASALFLMVAIKIYASNKKYLLNRIFLLTFLSFSLYLLLDIFVYIFAPYSATMLLIANIVFKIQLFILTLYMYMLFLASLIVKNGSESMQSKRVWIIGGILLVLMVFICIFKIIVVLDSNGEVITDLPPVTSGFKATNATGEGYSDILVLLITGFPLLLDVYTIVLFTQVKNGLQSNDPARKQMVYFIIGIILIPAGLIYFILQGMIAFNSYPSIILGYAIWIASPFFIWKSQIGKKK